MKTLKTGKKAKKASRKQSSSTGDTAKRKQPKKPKAKAKPKTKLKVAPIPEQTPEPVDDTKTIEVLMAPYGHKKGVPNLATKTQNKVLDWIDAVRAKPIEETEHIPILYISGGVGSGKTRAFLAGVLEMLTEIPDLRALWCRKNYKDLELSAKEKFFEILPPELIGKRNETYKWYEIKQDGGSKARINFSGAKEISGLGSQEFAVIVVTEAYELKYSTFTALKRRCRQEGKHVMILMESEPPNEAHWLCQVTDPLAEEYDSDIEHWVLSTYENWDNLPLAYKGSLEKMPNAWKKKYLMGQPGFVPDGKPFYDEFRQERHAMYELEYTPGLPVYRVLDFGYHYPAVLWAQRDRQDRMGILDEILGKDILLTRFIEQFSVRENERFPDAEFITFYDPAGEHDRDAKSEKTSVDLLNDAGIYGRCKQSTYRERKELIGNRLNTIIRDLPALLFDPRVKILIDGMLGGYHYPEVNEGRKGVEGPADDGYYEHLCNCLEYLFVNLYTVGKNKKKVNAHKYSQSNVHKKRFGRKRMAI